MHSDSPSFAAAQSQLYLYNADEDKIVKVDSQLSHVEVSGESTITTPDLISNFGIPDDPYAKLFVYFSKDKQRIVFPRSGTYWIKDLKTGLEQSLGLTYSHETWSRLSQLDVFWSDDHTVIIQDNFPAGVTDPFGNVIQVNIENNRIVVQRLVDLEPWKSMVFDQSSNTIYSDLVINGVSLSGKYIVAEPYLSDNAWLYTKSGVISMLDFSLYNDYRLFWPNDNTFIAQNGNEVIEYNVVKKATLILFNGSANVAGLQQNVPIETSILTLSPTAQYIMENYKYTNTNGYIVSGISSCRTNFRLASSN